jgi:hypothetical protein
VTSLISIDQVFVAGSKSEIEAMISSPGITLNESMVTATAGNISYHDEYAPRPFVESCSVPTWINVPSNCPPMPIHTAEKESLNETLTAGTIQDALTLVTMGCGVFKSEATA